MRRGGRPDELVQHVTLPPALADSPYLQEFYGTVAWSVRAIYVDYAGWFDGNPTKLFPLPEKDRAARVLELVGGRDQVLSRARRALASKEFQGRRADRLRPGDRPRKRRGEAAEGGGAERARRASDSRDCTELLSVSRPVSAARPARPVGTAVPYKLAASVQ